MEIYYLFFLYIFLPDLYGLFFLITKSRLVLGLILPGVDIEIWKVV